MSISRDLMIMAALAVAFVILLAVLIKIFARKNNLRRNLTRIQGRILFLVILSLLGVIAFAWVSSFKQSGVGRLFTDADSPKDFIAAVGAYNGEADIVIEGDRVIVSGRKYNSLDEASGEVASIAQEKENITVTDRYGQAKTVVGVIEILKTYGADIDTGDVIIDE